MRHQPIVAALAVVVMAGSAALAHQRDPGHGLACPSLDRQSRMKALETRIESMRARLDGLDLRLQSFEADRRRTLEEVKASVEAAARDPSRSQAEIDWAVTAALARADIKAKSVAQAAASAHAEMATTRSQLDGLLQQLHSLARAEESHHENS